MTARLTPEQLNQLLTAIAHEAIDRMFDEQSLTPETNLMNSNENPKTAKKRGRGLYTPESSASPTGISSQHQPGTHPNEMPLARTSPEVRHGSR